MYLNEPFFEYYERIRLEQISFIWKPCTEKVSISPEEYLHEGKLTTLNESSRTTTNYYVLGMQSIIAYEDGNSQINNNPIAILQLRNPMLTEIEKFGMYIFVLINRKGFNLKGYQGSFSFFCNSKNEQKEWIAKLKRICVLEKINSQYIFGTILGKGYSGDVTLATRIEDEAKFAIKTISKSRVMKSVKTTKLLIQEIEILRTLNHPNIIKLYEVYESDFDIQLVFEYIKGMNLLSSIKVKGTYSEKDASIIILKALEALEYCHSKNIIHRDIKPENIIIKYFTYLDSYNAQKIELKLLDFGFATILNHDHLEITMCGSPGYAAPEIYEQSGYDTKVDIFSLGVVLYLLYFYYN